MPYNTDYLSTNLKLFSEKEAVIKKGTCNIIIYGLIHLQMNTELDLLRQIA